MMSANHPVMTGQECPYCGNPSSYVDSAVIYGKSYGMIYLCQLCDAYVGVHKGTDRALGRLANRELREWNKRAHYWFDQLWRNGPMRREEAYEWLSEEMGIRREITHIGMFNEATCKKAVDLCMNKLSQYERRTTDECYRGNTV